MNPDVTEYLATLQPWQAEIVNALRDRIHAAVPDVQERLQYRKPHFLKEGKYLAALSPARAQVTLTVFNATDLDAPDGPFEPGGPPERKTVRIGEGQAFDGDLLAGLVARAASTL
jgi:hypothetical protein